MMDEVDVTPMHEDFARWYGVVSLGDDHARRQARWAGVSNVVGTAKRETVETLLRLAHRSRKTPAVADLQAFQRAFKSADDAFEMSGNDRELQILAAASLAVLMEADESASAVAALAATTAGLGGARKPELPMDLEKLGEAAITRLGEARRERPPLPSQVASEPPKVDFAKAAEKVREQPQTWESIAAAFTLAADSARSALRQFAQRQAKVAETIYRFLQVQDEELQMLWWLTGQRSWDFECAFHEVPADAQPLVFACELAEITKLLPGPPAVNVLLSRAGLKDRKKTSVLAAVNAARSDWLEKVLGDADPSPVSTPLHAAIKRQLETGAGDAWVAGWEASTEIKAGYALSGQRLGNLFYRECVLLRFR